MIGVGDVVRIPHYDTCPGRFRVYLIVACALGGTNQEGTYELRCCDLLENERINIPCIVLESHPEIQIYKVDKWISVPIEHRRGRYARKGEEK